MKVFGSATTSTATTSTHLDALLTDSPLEVTKAQTLTCVSELARSMGCLRIDHDQNSQNSNALYQYRCNLDKHCMMGSSSNRQVALSE